MTSDEVERAIKFLLDSQAQLTANVDRLSETVDKLSVKVDRTADSVTALLAIAQIHERKIVALNEAARATDDKLNALITTVDRFISQRGES